MQTLSNTAYADNEFLAEDDTPSETAFLAFQKMAIPAFVLDREGKVRIWNPACERLTGLSAHEVLGTREHWRGFYAQPRPCLADLALRGKTDSIMKLYEKDDSASGDNFRAENWCDLPKGERRYLLIDACPIFDEEGRSIGVVETLQDATVLEEARSETDRQHGEQARVVEAIAGGLRTMARGNLAERIEGPFPPAYEALRHDYNDAVEKLGHALDVVMGKADAIRSHTGELLAGAEDLAQRAELQAARLEETTASLSEISKTVVATSEGAAEAQKAISAMRAHSESTEGAVKNTITAMDAIKESSEGIRQILSVIDEIAFQTNLLALNAGVEAARAGDAGRGFAIVAQEVRALAQRSATAAKDIKDLIGTSAEKVGEGVKLVGETGNRIEDILAQITHINEFIVKLAGSTQEQALQLNEIGSCMQGIDQATQDNALAAQQTSENSRNVAEDTKALAGLLGQFQIRP